MHSDALATVAAVIPPTGIEQHADCSANLQISGVTGAESGALILDSEPEFREILAAWPELDADSKAAVVATLRAQVEKRAEHKRQGKAETRESSTSSAAGGHTHVVRHRGASFGRRAPGVFAERPQSSDAEGGE